MLVGSGMRVSLLEGSSPKCLPYTGYLGAGREQPQPAGLRGFPQVLPPPSGCSQLRRDTGDSRAPVFGGDTPAGGPNPGDIPQKAPRNTRGLGAAGAASRTVGCTDRPALKQLGSPETALPGGVAGWPSFLSHIWVVLD